MLYEVITLAAAGRPEHTAFIACHQKLDPALKPWKFLFYIYFKQHTHHLVIARFAASLSSRTVKERPMETMHKLSAIA